MVEPLRPARAGRVDLDGAVVEDPRCRSAAEGSENDAVALEAARQGAALNGVTNIEWVLIDDPAAVPGQFQIVIANILLNTLEELAPSIASKVAPGGRLVLSGLLAEQAGAAERAYVALGLRAIGRKEREGWVRVELSRPGSGAG